MSAEELSEHEKQVLGYTTDSESAGDDEIAESPESLEERVAELADTVEDLQRELAETQRELEEERRQKKDLFRMVNQLQRDVEGGAKLTGATTLQKYSQMTTEEREDLLPTSERRAVEVYQHWDDLAWNVNGTQMMETTARVNAKNQPSQIKYRLEQHFGEDLAWNEVYRLLKAMAKLSGGEERTDEENYTYIEGGDFEYHVESTIDTKRTRRLLKEAEA